jgi:hypothetical protein
MPQQFPVDDDLAALVWKLAKPKPFENLSFSAALRRVLQNEVRPTSKDAQHDDLEDLYAEALVASRDKGKKVPSPSASEWVARVPELRARKGLTTWKAICDVLKIDTAGDSARRRLRNWVKVNRPTWPPVPSIRSQ